MIETIRIPKLEVLPPMIAALVKRGFTENRARLSAGLFLEATLDGVYTHGLERFPRFAEWIDQGWVRPAAEPELVTAFGALERWKGNLGPGNLNALAMADRAVEVANIHGIGCIALSDTNHWMRGGQYGLRIADSGFAALCWTNTLPNLPAWGSQESVLGNNPLVIALPRQGGPVLLDMAMSQFSYGKMEGAALRGELLPVDGGFDMKGQLTRDPGAILESRRPLPAGFWKGSSLSLVLDLLGVMLSGGDSVGEIGLRGNDNGQSQVFIAIDLSRLGDGASLEAAINEMEARIHGASPVEPGRGVRFPGEGRLATKVENEERGLPLRENLWKEILALA